MDSNKRIVIILTLILAFALAVASWTGGFVSGTYDRDTESMAVQGIGQDRYDLFFIVSLLLIALLFMIRGSRIAHFILTGTVFYILYSFVIYAFGLHFNRLFLLYCLTLGTSFYLFILLVTMLVQNQADQWLLNPPRRTVTIFIILVASLFYLLWLKEIVPSILKNHIPRTISEYGLLVNPVHVLDLAVVLPGMMITSLLILKKHAFGLIMASVFIIFIILLSFALLSMVLMLKAYDISEDISVAFIFAGLGLVGFVILILFFKK